MGIRTSQKGSNENSWRIYKRIILGLHVANIIPVSVSKLLGQLKRLESSNLTHIRNCTILLFRPKSNKEGSPDEAERDTRARAAADFITRLAEDLLATGMIHSGLIHMYRRAHSSLSNDRTDNYQGPCIILCAVNTYTRHMPQRINTPPTRREQITTVHAGTERDSQVMACQNLDLKGIRQPNEKIDRTRV